MDKVRILHIGLSDRRYGTEEVVMNLYRNLDRTLYQFDFLVGHGYLHVDYEDEVRNMGGRIFYQYYSIKDRNKTGYLSPDDFFKDHPEILGIHYHANDYSASMFRYVMAAIERELPIRVIHSHNSKMMERKLKNCIHRVMVQQLIRKCSASFISCSEAAGKWNFGKLSFEILSNGIDPDRFAYNKVAREMLRRRHNLRDKLVLGFAGRLHFQKNPKFLLKVLQAVNRRCDRAVLVLLGEGELEGLLKREVEKNKLENVLFMGRVDNVHEWFQAFDVLLLPSRFEGLGLVLIEAQASGLMCIASDHVPKETAVTERILYLSTKDAGKWADAALKTDFMYDRNRGKAEVIHAGYDSRESAKRLEEIYESKINHISIQIQGK